MAEGAPDSRRQLDSCRQLGRRQAEELDLELRREEARQRRRRLAEAGQPGIRPRLKDDEAALRIVQLETRLSELDAYVRTIHESRPWRAVQWLRRLFGRAW